MISSRWPRSAGPGARALRVALGVVGGLALLTGVCSAQVTSDRSASILIFPEVFTDATRDTIIQVTNVNNGRTSARCFYASASGTCGSNSAACTTSADCPVGDVCAFQQTQTEFDISLTRQQPTVWVVSKGSLPDNAPPGLGNLVPALPAPFRGELLCVEVIAGAPFSGNHLIGAATLVDTTGGDVAKYHAVGISGNENNDGDNTLCIGGNVTNNCPNGAEYDACPLRATLDHLADGASDAVAGAGSGVHTTLAVAPCTIDLTSQTPSTVDLEFATVNQLAVTFSSGTTVVGPSEIPFASITGFTRVTLGTDYARTEISPAAGDGHGIVAVAQELHIAGAAPPLTASQALSPHVLSDRTGQDLIVLP